MSEQVDVKPNSPKEMRKRWVEALRSGKYKQARKVLRSSEDFFCCLGVACDIADASVWHQRKDFTYWYRESRLSLLKETRDLFGLTIDQTDYLAEQNDLGATFEDIANTIEKMDYKGTVPRAR